MCVCDHEAQPVLREGVSQFSFKLVGHACEVKTTSQFQDSPVYNPSDNKLSKMLLIVKKSNLMLLADYCVDYCLAWPLVSLS